MSKRKRETDCGIAKGKVVSFGLLLYKCDSDQNIASSSSVASSKTKLDIRFLVGLIPQRNWWTVFKGLPEGSETPYETAMREFKEETGILDASIISRLSASLEQQKSTTLHAKVGSSKDLHIFLVDGAFVAESNFDSSRVAKIDQGYMKGKPEIIAIQWLSLEQALQGTNGAKLYTSQHALLREAHQFVVLTKETEKNQRKATLDTKGDETNDGSDNVAC
ncbi:hypothetical protein MPSEU_001040500 [Mayamaea pseudoterrestris]|nr:hypothetical protein MPSEU_001040500 [Mayamaea pseudoterrestris]